jgi:hypothetical protein
MRATAAWLEETAGQLRSGPLPWWAYGTDPIVLAADYEERAAGLRAAERDAR